MVSSDVLTKALASPIFFDAEFMALAPARATKVGATALLARAQDPANPKPPNPNAIFNCAWYSKAAGLKIRAGNVNPILHYLTQGIALGLAPNRFFDPQYFRKMHAESAVDGQSDVEQALILMRHEIPAIHPLIDPQYMAAQLGVSADRAFLRRLLAGDVPKCNPHRLFDVAHYEQAAGKTFASLAEVLDHYYSDRGIEQTSVLFSPDFYRHQLRNHRPSRRLLHHYLAENASVDVHPMLNGANYRSAVRQLTGETIERPMEHYLQFGEKLGLSPGPFFDVSHYAEKSGQTVDLLKHYLGGGHAEFSAHPAIDSRTATKSAPHSLGLAMAQRRGKPFDFTMVDAERYRGLYPKVAESAENPALHFLRTGFRRALSPNGLISIPYCITSQRKTSVQPAQAIESYLVRGLHQRPRILIVLRDLTDRAVTQMWAAILEVQPPDGSVEFVILACDGGSMLDRFRQVAHVWVVPDDKGSKADDAAIETSLNRVLGFLRPNLPAVAVVEVGHTPGILQIVAGARLPVIAMLDEQTSGMEPEHLSQVVGKSAHLLVAGKATAAMLALRYASLRGRQTVFPSLLISLPKFGAITRAVRRQAILQALNLPETAILVAGCGAMVFENGVDRFGLLAKMVLDRLPAENQLHFVWAGDGPVHSDTPYFYARHHLRVAGHADRLHHLTEAHRKDLRIGADLFVQPEVVGADTSDARSCDGLVLAIASAGAEIELGANVEMYSPTDLAAAADRIVQLIQDDMPRTHPVPQKNSGIGTLIVSLNAALVKVGVGEARLQASPVHPVKSLVIFRDTMDSVALVRQLGKPIDRYIMLSADGHIPAEVRAALPRDQVDILSGAGQSKLILENLLRLALRNYAAKAVYVVGLQAVLPNLDPSAPGRRTTWLVSGREEGDPRSLAALAEVFDAVLQSKDGKLVAIRPETMLEASPVAVRVQV